MSDNPFETEVPAGQAPVDEMTEFLDGIEETEGFDLNQVVTLRSSTGQSYTVPVEGPTPIREVLRRSNLAFSQNIETWVNGNRVEPDFEVAAGATVTLVGVVKGG